MQMNKFTGQGEIKCQISILFVQCHLHVQSTLLDMTPVADPDRTPRIASDMIFMWSNSMENNLNLPYQ